MQKSLDNATVEVKKSEMKKWLEEWLEEYGDILGFLLFCFIVALLMKGCDMVS